MCSVLSALCLNGAKELCVVKMRYQIKEYLTKIKLQMCNFIVNIFRDIYISIELITLAQLYQIAIIYIATVTSNFQVETRVCNSEMDPVEFDYVCLGKQ